MHYVMNELQISKSSIEYYSIAHSEQFNGISLKIVRLYHQDEWGGQ